MAMAAFRETLAGLSGVNVQVEPVNADAERDGLTRADLQHDVESRLRAVGIRLFTEPELFYAAPGTPVLHLDVMTIRLDGRYAYSVRLELWQAVTLTRDASIRALGLTWSNPQIVGTVSAESLGEVHAAVQRVLDEFIADYGAAQSQRMARRPNGR